jgi:hypothetical protein
MAAANGISDAARYVANILASKYVKQLAVAYDGCAPKGKCQH